MYPDPSINKQKFILKNLDFYNFVTFFLLYLISLNTAVNVLTVSKKPKKT
jgi:hypothetical protein